MKREIIAVIVLIFCLCLCACSNGDNISESGEPSSSFSQKADSSTGRENTSQVDISSPFFSTGEGNLTVSKMLGIHRGFLAFFSLQFPSSHEKSGHFDFRDTP